MRISGIYKIVNRINGKSYIGSSVNITFRWYVHKYELNSQIHDNIHLQRAWNKYGKENFNFEIIEEVPQNELLKKEQKYLNECKSNPRLYYNEVYEAGGFIDRKGINNGFYGKTHTKEVREKISKVHKGKIVPKEVKKKISENNARYWKGKHISEETKKKISIGNTGKIRTNEEKEKLKSVMLENRYNISAKNYSFTNRVTNEIYNGTQYDFRKKYNLKQYNVSRLVNKIRPSHKNWILS